MDAIVEFIGTYPEWHQMGIISQDHEMFRKVGMVINYNIVTSSLVNIQGSLYVCVHNYLVHSIERYTCACV